MSKAARAAADAFYATFRETGRRVDKNTLELAWERAVAAAIKVWET